MPTGIHELIQTLSVQCCFSLCQFVLRTTFPHFSHDLHCILYLKGARSHRAPVPLCLSPAVFLSRCVPVPLYPSPVVFQSGVSKSCFVPFSCVPLLLCPCPVVSQSVVPQSRCAPVPLCPCPVVSQSRCVPVLLCSSPVVSQSCCVPVPLCPSPVDASRPAPVSPLNVLLAT